MHLQHLIPKRARAQGWCVALVDLPVISTEGFEKPSVSQQFRLDDFTILVHRKRIDQLQKMAMNLCMDAPRDLLPEQAEQQKPDHRQGDNIRAKSNQNGLRLQRP